ncbi:hypothetical protein CerSpe_279430 [Prunus speciosa]
MGFKANHASSFFDSRELSLSVHQSLRSDLKEALFLRSYEGALRFLLVWALGCLVAEMESGKWIWDHSPGVNIFKLLMRKLWTAEMLLSHPFVSDYDTVLVEDKEELFRWITISKRQF